MPFPEATEPSSLRVLRLLRNEAPRILRERGRPFPEEILWSGLPQEDETDPEDPVEVREPRAAGPPLGLVAREPLAWLEVRTAEWIRTHPRRKQAGLYLTRPEAARTLLARAAAGGARPRTVLDPAVGAGVFLREAQRRFGPEVEAHGVDLDPSAVVLTRLGLWIDARARGGKPDPEALAAAIRWGDSLYDADRWISARASGGYDLVCGNPPFGNAIEGRTARTRAQLGRLREIFPETARGPFDRCVPFVQLAAGLLAPGGRLALLVPRAILAARYATALRAWLAAEAPLAEVVVFPAGGAVPEAEIAMVGCIAERARSRGPARTVAVYGAAAERPTRRVPRSVLRPESWAGLVEPLAPLLEGNAARHPCLRELFDVRAAASVADAYLLSKALREGGRGWRFLTTGLLDRYHERWGERPARYLGRTFQRPVLPRGAAVVPAGRRRLYEGAKIIVAGLSPRLESFFDVEARCAGGVGTLLVLARPGGPHVSAPVWLRCLLLLNSAWLSALHRGRRGPLSLAGGSLPLGRRDVEELPWPRILLERAASAPRALQQSLLGDPAADLPEDPAILLDLLDRAAQAIVRRDSGHEAWDALAQRVLLRLAGLSDREAERILLASTPRPAAQAGRNRPRPTAKKLAITAS